MSMIMTVQCPECGTEFPVDPRKVPETGVRAQCSVCPGIFPVFRPEGYDPAEAEFETWVESPVGAEALPGAEAPSEEETSHYEVESAQAFDEYFEPVLEPEEVDSAGEVGTLEQALEEARGDFSAAEPGSVGLEPPGLEHTSVEPDSEVAPPQPEMEIPAPTPIQFGRRDPHEKARRLARVLVSDMIVYHREKHALALESGTLREEFEEEVQKSWEEYVEQVGLEMAESTPYFNDALNEILAKGEMVF